MIADSDRTTVSAAAYVLAKERVQKRKRLPRNPRVTNRPATSNRRSGATAVEFVVVLPLLIGLCLTSLDFGRFAHAYLALGNAGRVGAEYGATHAYSSTTAASWKQRIKEAVQQDFTAIGDIDPTQLDVQVAVTNDSYDLTRTTITTTYPFQTVVSWPTIPRPIMMQRTVAFRRFR
jgi:Flp pilus assembly protein TadG